jgi:hypothetical protein
MFIYAIRCRTCTCRTCNEQMCHPFGNDESHMNWDAWFLNCPTYFGQPENGDYCMLSGVYLSVSFIHDFGSVTLLFFDTPISGVWSENNGVMLPKSWMKDTQVRHQITRDSHYSYVGLRHILHNRVLTFHLSFMTSCIVFHSIEYGRVSLRLQPSQLLANIAISCFLPLVG